MDRSISGYIVRYKHVDMCACIHISGYLDLEMAMSLQAAAPRCIEADKLSSSSFVARRQDLQSPIKGVLVGPVGWGIPFKVI